MSLKRHWNQRPNTKHQGELHTVFGFFVIQFVLVIVLVVLRMEEILVTSMELENILASSNLAACQIDIQSFGRDYRIVIPDAKKAREEFIAALEANMGGYDGSGALSRRLSIVSPVTVEVFCVINVSGSQVECIQVDEAGNCSREYGILGVAKASNGQIIEGTGVYSRVSCKLEGILGRNQWIPARKEKLTEIKKRD